MKKFITKTLLYCLLILLMIGGFYGYKYYQKKNEIVKLPKSNIIIGDSNTRWSLNDSIIHNYSNYSVGGETYLFAYTKLKIFDKNNKIDTLILAFSPHNIVNNIWWNDDVQQPIQNRMPMFYQNFEWQDHLVLLKNIPKNYLSSLMKIGKQETAFLFNTKTGGMQHSRFGSYMPEIKNENQFKKTPYEYKTPEITTPEIEYLNKIIVECKVKSIHLILINPPKNYLRSDYKYYAHPEFYDYYHKNLSNVDFLDFSILPLPANSYYDMNHVSKLGAEYFSNFIEKNGINNLLHSPYNLKNDHR